MKRGNLVYPFAPPAYPLYDRTTIHDESGWQINNVHDPAIVKDGEWYYVFSTDRKVGADEKHPIKPGLQVRRSRDLIHWEWVGYALPGVPEEARRWTGAEILWAPDVAKFGDTYYLYYVASRFGTDHSFIGVATGPSILGPWSDQGEVLKTASDAHPNASGETPNAIDPNVAFDADGDPWLVYGSFFGGIYLARLNPRTGKLLHPGYGTLLAKRSAAALGAIEGPYLIYHPELRYYYLFVSYDSLFSDYNVRVGRAERITGPYLDYNGRALTDTNSPPAEVGTKILGGYRFRNDPGWIAPGHSSVLRDGNDYFLVHHARGGVDPEWSYLHVRRILWSDDGWPLVAPERYAGEYPQPIPPGLLPGEWELLILARQVNTQLDSFVVAFTEDGLLKGESIQGTWRFEADDRLVLSWWRETGDGTGQHLACLRLMPAWDWENRGPTLIGSGLDRDGTAIWGKKCPVEAVHAN
ncbi:MAG: arabinan endo-1,5-alpha-L-arabinosidase [Bacillota bacterium]